MRTTIEANLAELARAREGRVATLDKVAALHPDVAELVPA